MENKNSQSLCNRVIEERDGIDDGELKKREKRCTQLLRMNKSITIVGSVWATIRIELFWVARARLTVAP